MTKQQPIIRRMEPDDLDAVNRIIEGAVMTWSLPDRVKRLSLPLYKYGAVDLAFLTMMVAERDGRVVGVAAWETADASQVPDGKRGLLLHGLYVDPQAHGCGVGTLLLRCCADAARDQGMDGVLVRVQPDAVSFFERQGLEQIPVLEPGRDYALRYWLAL